jgi:response regulator NasT
MAQRSILIVEDDPAVTAMLTLAFRLEGYRVVTATDGLPALQLLTAGTTPDLMLLDMHMEGLNGWGLSAELEHFRHKVPILVMTADRDPAACAEQVGAAAYLQKPLDLHELLHTVEQLLPPEAPRRRRAG